MTAATPSSGPSPASPKAQRSIVGGTGDDDHLHGGDGNDVVLTGTA